MNMTPINALLLISLMVSLLIGCYRLAEAFRRDRRDGIVPVRPIVLPLSTVTLLLLSKICDLEVKHGLGGVQIWEQASWALFLCAMSLMVVGVKKGWGRD